MPKKVAKIDAVYSIDGMGTVIALPKEEEWALAPKEQIHCRERIQIRTKDGRCLSTFIRSIEFVNRGRERNGVCFGLPSSVAAAEIPDGSELWLERNGVEPVLEPN